MNTENLETTTEQPMSFAKYTILDCYRILVQDIDPNHIMPMLSDYIIKHYGQDALRFFFRALPEIILHSNNLCLEDFKKEPLSGELVALTKLYS